MREALASVHSWMGRQLDHGSDALPEKVVSGEGGRRVVTDGARGAERPAREPRSINIAQVEVRSRWKEAALRFAAERRKSDDPSAAGFAAREAELREARGSLEEAYPWMLDTRMGGGEDAILDAADCYDVVAYVAQNIQNLSACGALDGGAPSELLYLVAEAQSALLAALAALGQRTDSDQRDLFLWLKDQTHRHRIYVDRHMRLEDPADAKGSADRKQRLEERFGLVRSTAAARAERGKLLNRLRFHVRKSLESQRVLGGDATTLTSALGRWRELGLPRDDRSLREIVAPVAELAEGDLAESLAWVLEPAAKPAPAGAPPEAPRRSPKDEARQLLRERKVLALAPDDAACDAERLSDALGLGTISAQVVPEAPCEQELAAWIDAEPTSLVLLGRRLDEGSYDTFKRLCLDRGRLFVRLPDGFEPEHVARQVLRQVGWRLRPEAARRPS